MAVHDIKITSLDEGATVLSARGALNDYALNISPQPDNMWIEHFDHIWKEHFTMMRREVTVRGDHMRVVCLEDELQDLINELKGIVTKANRSYAERMDVLENGARAEAEAALAERQRIADLAKGLKF